jgi:hypothetical protein
MTTVRLVRLLCVGLAVAASVAACGRTQTIDPQQLGADLSRQVSKGGTETTISCPGGQPATAGTTFTCTSASAKGALVYDVTITSDTGAYAYALAPNQLIDSGALTAELTTQIKGTDLALAGVVVTCPPSILAPAGAVDTTCTAVAGTTQLPVRVTGPPGRPLTWVFATT